MRKSESTINAKPKTKTVRKAPVAKKAVEEATKQPVAPVSVKASSGAALLLSPRISEKAAGVSSRGAYIFNVAIEANKIEIRKAVEALYGVDVVTVRTLRGSGKIVRRGRTMGRRNQWKKAVVTVKNGQRIDLYPGV